MHRRWILCLIVVMLFRPLTSVGEQRFFDHAILQGVNGYQFNETEHVWIYWDSVRLCDALPSLDTLYAAVPVNGCIANYMVFALSYENQNEMLKEVVIWADDMRIGIPLRQHGISVTGKKASLISGAVMLTPKDTGMLGLLKNAEQIKLRISTNKRDCEIAPTQETWKQFAEILNVVTKYGVLLHAGEEECFPPNGITIE